MVTPTFGFCDCCGKKVFSHVTTGQKEICERLEVNGKLTTVRHTCMFDFVESAPALALIVEDKPAIRRHTHD